MCGCLPTNSYTVAESQPIDGAAAAIVRAWHRVGLSDAEAREQADNFIHRFHRLGAASDERALDATLAAVADVMGTPL